MEKASTVSLYALRCFLLSHCAASITISDAISRMNVIRCSDWGSLSKTFVCYISKQNPKLSCSTHVGGPAVHRILHPRCFDGISLFSRSILDFLHEAPKRTFHTSFSRSIAYGLLLLISRSTMVVCSQHFGGFIADFLFGFPEFFGKSKASPKARNLRSFRGQWSVVREVEMAAFGRAVYRITSMLFGIACVAGRRIPVRTPLAGSQWGPFGGHSLIVG